MSVKRQLTSTEQARVTEVANILRGQCSQGLSDVATEAERDDTIWLTALDQEVRLCDGCAWWIDADDIDDSTGDSLCEDCIE